MTAKAPNILIVMADQMAPAFLPIYGHPLVRIAAAQPPASTTAVSSVDSTAFALRDLNRHRNPPHSPCRVSKLSQ
jgi:arylsulfatase A-like enzyme